VGLTYKSIIFADVYDAVAERIIDFSGPQRAGKYPHYPGIDGIDYVNLGKRGRPFTYTCIIDAESEGDRVTAMNAIEDLDNGEPGAIAMTGRPTLGQTVIADGGISWSEFRKTTGGRYPVRLTIQFIELTEPTT
jgi:hypothetical protein